MNILFPFTRTALKSLFLIVLFLFGGVSIEHNRISLGATSCNAITVSDLPARTKEVRKSNRLNKQVAQLLQRESYSKYDIAVMLLLIVVYGPFLILGGGSIALIVWAINLFISSNLVGGIFALFGAAIALYYFYRHYIWLENGGPGKFGGG